MNENLKKNYVKFGILQIHHRDIYDNKLKVLYLSGSPFPKVRSQMVSDDLQSLIVDIIETNAENEIDNTTVQKLTNRERDIFHTLIKSSGLQQKLKYKYKPRSIDDVKKRFEVVQGSIEAGNDSKEVIDEALDLVKILMLAGKIDPEEGKDLLKSFE